MIDFLHKLAKIAASTGATHLQLPFGRSSRMHPHNPWHTKGPLVRGGEQDRFPTRPHRSRFAELKSSPKRKRHKGGRPLRTYRAARRNIEFGRKPVGNTTPMERRDRMARTLGGLAND